MSEDPFAQQERYPSVSWKDAKIGTMIDGIVIEAPKQVQARNFETGEMDFWEDGNKKMTVVVGLELKDGDKRSLWCPIPSAIFAAVAQAQKDSGELIGEGGRLRVKFVGEEENRKNPKLNKKKLFKAKYTPPDAFAQPEPAPEPESKPEPETTTADTDFDDDDPPF